MFSKIEAAQETLQHAGFATAEYLASGMEGHVFRVGAARVAKVWHLKPVSEVTSLQQFYEQVLALGLPFATPHILQVDEVDGRVVSLEKELHGTSMRELVRDDDPEPPDYLEAFLTILEALQTHALPNEESALPVLGVTPSREAQRSGGTAVLLEVAERKVARYGSQLRASLPNFDWLYTRTVHHLRHLETPVGHAIHGDLCPENVLLDEHRRVSTVLDWGFLSLFGDPALDASIASGLYNMYGLNHLQIDKIFLKAYEQRLGYSRERLLLYRSLYALVSSNAYSEDGSDGQYAWCVATLRREDIRDALAKEHIS